MKRTLLLILFALSLSYWGWGQTYLTESFEGTWSGTPAAPSGWSIQHTTATGGSSGTDPMYWVKNTWNGSAWSPAGNGTPTTPTGAYDGSSVAWYNDYNAKATQKDELRTGTVDLSSSINPRVTFYLAIDASSSVTIKVRGFNGTSWADIQTVTKPGVAWTKISIAIPVAYKVATAKFGVEVTASYGYYDVWMDKFVIDETPAALTGTKTIKSSGGDYASFTAAINALNEAGVGAGGVTFNVDAGYVSSENCPVITATGTAANTITFQKSGAGNNPKITPSGTAGTADAGIIINGGDYITFDGIDIDASAVTAVEYGYLIRNATATNGAQYNTIKNCAITLNRGSNSATSTSSAIFQTASTTGGGVVPTNATGANSYNKYYNLTIQSALNGVYLNGHGTYRDLSCEVGTTSASSRSSITNLGPTSNTSVSARGICAFQQEGVKIFNNDISSVAGDQAASYGIYFTTCYGTANEIYSNKIHTINVKGSTSTTSAAYGLRADLPTSGTHNVKIYNNFISNIYTSFTSVATVSRYAFGMFIGISGATSSQSYDIDNNSISIGSGLTPTYSNTCYELQNSLPSLRFRGNVFANHTNAQTGLAKHFCAVVTNADIGGTGTALDYNDYYIANSQGTSGHVGRNNSFSTNYNTIADWKTFTTGTLDDNSFSSDPSFTNNNTDLHAVGAGLNAVSGFSTQAWVTTDIDNEARSSLSPSDVGADAFNLNDQTSIAEAPATQVTGTTVASTVTTVGAAVEVFRFKITDVGAPGDGLATKVTNVRITNANPVNGASWTANIAGLKLNDGTSDITIGTPTIAASYIDVPISSGNLDVANGSSKTITLAIYLKTSGIEDGKKLQFSIPATSHGFSSDGSGSRFAADFGAAVTGNEHTITVTATKLVFSNVPSSVLIDANFSSTVTATDANGNTDLDNTVSVTLARNSGTGTLSSITGLTQSLVNGTLTWTDLKYNKMETFRIQADGGSLTQGITGDIVCSNIIIIGTGTSAQTYPFNVYFGYSRNAALYTQSEIGAYLTLNKLAWQIATAQTTNCPVKVYLKKTSNTTITADTWANMISGATLVYDGTVQFTPSGWFDIVFSTPFNYDSDNLLVLTEANYGGSGNGSYPTFNYTTATSMNANQQADNSPPTGSLTVGNNRPNIKIVLPVAKSLAGITYNQASTNPVSVGSSNQEILRLDFAVTGTTGTLNLNSIVVTSNNMDDADVSNVKLYRTTTTTFNTSNLLGTQTFSGGTATFSSLSYDLPGDATTYIWVTYDIEAGATVWNTVDAQILANSIDVASTTYPASAQSPAGSRTITDEKLLSSVTVTQASTATAIKGSSNNETLLLDFNVTGSTGTLPLNSIAVTYTGTASADITASGVKLYRTATAVFATTNLLGAAQSLSGGIATFSSLSYDLPTGHTYVWVTFDVASGATTNNKVDAKIAANGINVNSVTYNSVEDNPAGNRNIFYNTYTLPFSEVFTGAVTALPTDWSYITTGFSQSTGATYHGKDNTHGIYYNIYSDYTTANAITPIMGTITASSYLDFDYRITDWISGWPTGMVATSLINLGTGTIKAQISTNGTDFTDVLTIDNTNHVVSTSFATKSVSLAAYVGQNVFIRFIATRGSTGDYYVDIDNVNVYTPANMAYSSSTTTQSVVTSVNAGATNQQVIGIQVVTTGNLSPIDLTKIVVNANGTTSVSDISNAKIWYTGTSSTFATTSQFGSTVASPTTANFDITGTQTLAQGTNYFWLTYDINSTAVNTNVIDAECTSITVGGSDYIPTATAPAGTRAIVNKTLTSITGNQASTAMVLQGATDQQVLRLDFAVAGPSDGSLLLNSIAATYTGTSASDIAASGVKLYTTASTTFATTNPLGTAQSLSGGIATFSGLNYNLPTGTSYIWVAFDIDAAATVNNTVDAKIAVNGIDVAGTTYNGTEIDPVGTRTIKAALAGTYTVGTGGNYTSFTKTDGLFADINSLGLSGNVTINVISDITDETGATALNQWTETGAGNYTLTIQPSEATERIISSTSAAHLFNLNGADRVTFDGRYSGSGKYLRIRNTNTGYTTFRFNNSAQNNVVKYCYVEGANTTAASGVIDFLTTGNNNSNLIDNCIIRDRSDVSGKPANGIYFAGKANASGNIISNNEIFNFTTYGVNLYSATSTTISGNQFYMTSASTQATVAAIYFADAPTTIISGNKIFDLNGSSSASVKGIYYVGATGVSMNVDIVNNSVVLSPTTTGNIDGIDYYGYAANSCNIYFNSVRIGGTHTSGTNATYAFRKRDNVTTMNIKNNVFVNARTNSGSTAKHYAIAFTTTTATSLSIDYNDYFTSGTGGVLGVYSSTDKTTLAAWKASTTQDAASKSFNPGFTSTTDLALLVSNNLGTPISGIDADFTGADRDDVNPDMGAYESNVANAVTFNGATDAWEVAANWTPNAVPNFATNVTIPANKLAVVNSNNYDCNNLTIAPLGQLTINTAKDLLANGAFLIQSDATGTGSLIENGTLVANSYTVQRYLTNYSANDDDIYHFISSPVAAQAIQPGWVADPPAANVDFYKFDEVTNYWINTKTEGGAWNTAFENNFVVGRGYLASYPTAPTTKSFTGNLNSYTAGSPLVLTCTHTVDKGNGWNLLGNPFPSAIDWTLVSLGNGMDNALYYYDAAAQNYRYYIRLAEIGNIGGGSQYIPAMQGFMVHAKSTGTKTVSIDNGDRVHNGQNIYYKSTNSIPGSFSLEVTAGGFSDEMFVHFNSDATTHFDGKFDAYKLSSYNQHVPKLYTQTSDGDKVAINGLPELSETTEIPVYFKAGIVGQQTITADLANIEATTFLVDLKTGNTQNLSLNPVYNFTSSEGDALWRFTLKFGSVGISENETLEGINIWSFDNSLYFNSPKTIDATISIFNITGQEVYSTLTRLDGMTQIRLNVPTGWYVVKVMCDEGIKSEKIFIR